MKHKDIRFKTRRTKAIEITKQNNREIGKEPDNTNPEDLLDYIHVKTIRSGLCFFLFSFSFLFSF